MIMKKKDFLVLLEKEADNQAKLQKRKILPEKLGGVWSFIAEQMWQVLLVISAILAFVITATKSGK